MAEAKEVRPSIGLSLGVLIVAAVIISCGVLVLGVDAHIPIVVSTVVVCCVGLIVLKKPWAEIEDVA